MRRIFCRAITNIPASVLLMFCGCAIAWAVQDPNWVIIKSVVVAPFVVLAAAPFFAAIHLVAAAAECVSARLGAPERLAAIIAAAAMGFLTGTAGSSDLGDPLVVHVAFVAAIAIPWLSPRPWFWAARFDR